METINMELKEIVEKQKNADRRHGFKFDFDSDVERYTQLTKDLVGLMGEIGEFANLAKKVGLGLEHSNYAGPSFEEANDDLRQEIADAMIYLIRLSLIVGADLEKEVLQKIAYNEVRYSALDVGKT